METAKRIAAMLKRNVDLWYADVITWERFSARQTTLWELATIHAVFDEVTELVVPKLGGLGRRKADCGNFNYAN